MDMLSVHKCNKSKCCNHKQNQQKHLQLQELEKGQLGIAIRKASKTAIRTLHWPILRDAANHRSNWQQLQRWLQDLHAHLI